ncbi:DNA repair protein RecO [Scatolibacter rhodanostii]|uniref:DNA repair protein RecO n=1 Tax=Scatolibacter rhodanostii TaxID=2014781 RepID=UPI000C06EC04|nr:DNA repair protein RecO [Scatolibacter rhodanostii]
MQIQTQGLIIREQTVGESDRLVTVLTADEGVLRAFARRAKNIKDSKNSATQILCYSRLNLYKGRDKYIINEAIPIEVFFDLRKDISRLSLAQYFCEIIAEFSPEGVDSAEYLRLALNALHFLCKGSKPELLLKSIIEMRLLTYAGYMPDIVGCASCNAYESPHMHFMINEANILCDNCFKPGPERSAPMNPAVLKAMRHILYSDTEKMFAFQLTESSQTELAAASEAYLLSILDRKPKTLDFYHMIAN